MAAPTPPAAFSLAVVTLYAALTAAGMLAGVWLMRRYESWATRHTGELIAFAAGLLVSGALLHFVAEAARLAGTGAALAWTLVAFLVLYVAEAHVVPHSHERAPADAAHGTEPSGRRTLGPMVVGGLGLHSVVDGVSVGAGFSAGPVVGWVALALVAAHKLPEGIAAMSALYASGYSGRAAAFTTSVLALITPAAVLLSFLFIPGIEAHALGILLALTGGAFLYVGAADLLPEGQARSRPANTVLFLVGVAAMVGAKLLE